MDEHVETPQTDPGAIPRARRPVEPMPRATGRGRVLARPAGRRPSLHDLIPRQHGRPHD